MILAQNKDCGALDSAPFDQAIVSPGIFGFRPAGSANADEIEPMLFDLETADPARLRYKRIQTRLDRRLDVRDASANAANQMVVRILDGLEMSDGHPEIELAQTTQRNQYAQVAVYSAQAQTREAALDELVDLVGSQMAAMPLDGLEDRLPLFCIADVHRKVPDGRILVRPPFIVNKAAGWRQTAE
jgi:hypothetical protein